MRRSLLTRLAAAAALGLLAQAGCRAPVSKEERESGIQLVFQSNRQVSEDSLRKELGEEIARSFRRGLEKADLSDLAFEVERVYRARGYHFAQVEYEHSPPRAVLRIGEGPRVYIQDIRFEGNTAFSDEALVAKLAEKRTGFLRVGRRIYVASDVEALARAVEDAYLERGYREVKVEKPEVEFNLERSAASITIKLSEGPRYVLQEMDFLKVPILSPKELSERLDPLLGSPYVPRLRLQVKSVVEELYGGRGYPDARAAVDATMRPGRPPGSQVAVALALRAEPGPRVTIREVSVRGNQETRESFIRSRLMIEGGDLYDVKKVRQSFQRLFNTGLFKTVDLRLEPVAGDASQRDLQVEVAEGHTLEYFFELGFGSYDLARAKAGVRERNVLGRGLIARAEVLGSIRGAEATLGLTDPWFLRSDWSADLPVTFLRREEPSFTIQEGKVNLRLSRRFLERLESGAIYRFDLSHLERLEVEARPGEERDLRVGAAGPFVGFDSRDDLIAPTRGLRSRAFVELGTPHLGGEISFIHTGVTASQYLKLLEGTVLASNLETTWIVPLGGTDFIPIQERLFSGGENSVRSFEQSEVGPKDPNGRPLGGEVRNLASLELRQRLWGNLWGAVFGDYGNIAPTQSRPWADFRPAVGAGLRYHLPIGPLRIDLAFNPDRRSDEDLFVAQFAIGLPY